MTQVKTKIIQVKRHFSDKEKLDIAGETYRISEQIADTEDKAKEIALDYKAKVQGLKTKHKELSYNFNRGYEYQEELAYIHLNHETKMRIFVSAKTGEILGEEEFLPRDYDNVQGDITHEEAKSAFVSLQDEAFDFFYFTLLNDETAKEITDAEEFINYMNPQLYKYCGLLVTHLTDKHKEKFATDTVIEFDTFFDEAKEWFDEFVAQRIEDDPKFRAVTEEPNGSDGVAAIDGGEFPFPTNGMEEQKPKPKPNKKKKGEEEPGPEGEQSENQEP
jgi:hypothetical protein